MRQLAFALLVAAGCASDTNELTLDIRESPEHRLFGSVELLHLRAERDGRALVERTFPPTASSVSVDGVPYGAQTVFALEGTSSAGDVVARGRTCPFDFLAPGAGGITSASIYFGPTNSFAPTPVAPLAVRADPVVLTMTNGDVLITGGRVDGAATASAERYSVATSAFTASEATLGHAREAAQVTEIAGVGALVTGGDDTDEQGLSTAEVFRQDTGLFTPFDSTVLGPRAGHRAVLISAERVLVTGGALSDGGAPLDTSVLVRVQAPDGTATATQGPSLINARRQHAAVLASGVPVLIGGYGATGAPLRSIEALVPTDVAGQSVFAEIAQLRTARAEATATLLDDGTILVVGGAGDTAGTPLVDAEVYNPITRQTTSFPLAVARRAHTATKLPDGRVLIVGGIDANGQPMSSVELFIPSVGFVSERPLGTPRAGHRTIALCDETVLVVGGGAGAELYTPP